MKLFIFQINGSVKFLPEVILILSVSTAGAATTYLWLMTANFLVKVPDMSRGIVIVGEIWKMQSVPVVIGNILMILAMQA